MMQSRECDTTLEPTTEDETPVEIAGTGDVLRAELVETFSRGTFTDLVLVCDGGSIPCHQAVLATHSAFIANILYQTSSCVCLEEEVSFLQPDSSDHTKWTSRGKAESLQLPSFQSVATILLPDFSLELVRSLLHFCYSGSVLLDKKNIASLVSLADLLEMDLVKELIAEGRKLFRKANVKKKAKQTPPLDSLNQSVVSSRWNCLVCQRTFRYEAKLNRHMQLVHTSSVIPCRHCGKTEFSQGSLTEHMRQDHPLKNFVCTLCAEERRFRRKASLLEHLRSVHPNAVNEAAQPYICDIPGCHGRFVRKSAFNRHMSTHYNGGKRFSCALCGKQFRSVSSFYAHKQSHSESRNFVCDVCGKAFKTNSNMRQHRRSVHAEMGPLWCSVCGKGFGRLDYLRKHEKSAHGKVITAMRKSYVVPVLPVDEISDPKLQEEIVETSDNGRSRSLGTVALPVQPTSVTFPKIDSRISSSSALEAALLSTVNLMLPQGWSGL